MYAKLARKASAKPGARFSSDCTHRKRIETAAEMEWIREDLRVLTLHGYITNRILANILPIAGGVEIARNALNRCADTDEILSVCSVTKNGLNIEPVMRCLDRVDDFQ